VDAALGEVVSVADALAEAVSVADALAELLAVGVALGDAGGDAQFGVVVAVVAALTANPVKITPVARNARPTLAPSAAGFRCNARTGCNLASISRPGTPLLVNLRHSTHPLGLAPHVGD